MIVTGINTTIVQALGTMVQDAIHRPDVDLAAFGASKIPFKDIMAENRYVFAQGHMVSERITDQSIEQIQTGLAVNLISVIQLCEFILDHNPEARICVVGSMSGVHGSFDDVYALSKAALHRYVETRRLSSPDQQLVGVAPTIIWDSGMTQRRGDLDRLATRRAGIPKGRFASAMEVARLIHFLLYVDEGFITNCVIPIDGGSRA